MWGGAHSDMKGGVPRLDFCSQPHLSPPGSMPAQMWAFLDFSVTLRLSRLWLMRNSRKRSYSCPPTPRACPLRDFWWVGFPVLTTDKLNFLPGESPPYLCS